MNVNLHRGLCLFALCLLPHFLSAQKIVPQWTSPAHIEGTEMIRPGQFTDMPAFIKFEKGKQILISDLDNWVRKNLKTGDKMGFELIRTEQDKLGYIHYRFQQTYLGKPVEDAIWIAHTIDNRVYSLNGMIHKTLFASSSATLSEAEALSKALSFVGAESYKWQMPGEEEHLKWEKNDPEATYLPKGELVYVSSDLRFKASDYKLVYKFNIYAHKPLYRAELYVDANTGEIVRENKLIHHVDEPGTAHTAYSGSQEIIADSFGGEFRLRDGSRGDGVRTFNLNQGTDYGSAEDFIDDDNDWNNINPELDEYATDAHWGAEMTYDYYLGVHGRNSLDNAGFQLNSYVHYDVDFFNAFWDGERMTYGDGDGAPSTPLTTLDIAGHEVTHGLTSMTADLIYSSESGALNESFSDIFGTAIEEFARPTDWDWLMGEEIGVTIRSMSNPNDFNCPDTYGGDFWDDVFEEVHTNSGVQNFWYYLLSEGGTGVNDNGDAYTVSAIGIDDASAIAFRNLTVYLTPSSNYEDARFYAIQSAVDLFGGCTFEVEQTANAWYAVGVGGEYSTEVVAAFSADETSGCTVPFTIDFSNESMNGITYLWDFGDGETSTEASPSHTYTAAGTYDVTLSVDGGSCGEDEIVMTDYIIIDPDLDCPVIFPTSGSGDPLTACEGVMFDSGGSDGDYGSNESGSVTISPVDAATVELTFEYFNVDFDFDFGCIYDQLRIYDGASVASPLIDTYCNDNPPGVITSTGPSITLAFESDDFFEFGGFKLTWACEAEIDDTGIDELENSQISIYPNPSNGRFTISMENLQAGSIEITDLIGKKILTTPFSGNSVDLDLSTGNAKGIYLVHIRDEKGELTNTQKIVIE